MVDVLYQRGSTRDRETGAVSVERRTAAARYRLLVACSATEQYGGYRPAEEPCFGRRCQLRIDRAARGCARLG